MKFGTNSQATLKIKWTYFDAMQNFLTNATDQIKIQIHRLIPD